MQKYPSKTLVPAILVMGGLAILAVSSGCAEDVGIDDEGPSAGAAGKSGADAGVGGVAGKGGSAGGAGEAGGGGAAGTAGTGGATGGGGLGGGGAGGTGGSGGNAGQGGMGGGGAGGLGGLGGGGAGGASGLGGGGAAGAAGQGGAIEAGVPPTLFFSEYVEGTSNNKALEIYNADTSAYDLSSCEIQRFSNGSPTPASGAIPAFTLNPGQVYVICNSQAGTELLAKCASTLGSLSFNGNDAVALVCNGIVLDVIGQIGVDPGTAWGTGSVTTLDHTLRRKCTVTTGRTNGTEAFDPATEWEGFPVDSFEELGQRTCGDAGVGGAGGAGGSAGAAGGEADASVGGSAGAAGAGGEPDASVGGSAGIAGNGGAGGGAGSGTGGNAGSADAGDEAEAGVMGHPILLEVLYDPINTDTNFEWIKLYNPTDGPIDLTGYSLGWGGSSYVYGKFDFASVAASLVPVPSLIIPAHGCFLVGGPTSGPASFDAVFDLAADFNPDLQNSGTTADGIALFHATADQVTAATIPIDAVVYGGSNTSNLIDETGQVSAVHVAASGSAQSLVFSVPAGTWSIQATPTPNTCP